MKADQLSLLPDLFARCSIALLICAAVLAVLIVPVRRMLENSRSSAAQNPQQRLTQASGRPGGAGLFCPIPPQQNKIPFSQCAMSHNVSVFFEITSLSGP